MKKCRDEVRVNEKRAGNTLIRRSITVTIPLSKSKKCARKQRSINTCSLNGSVAKSGNIACACSPAKMRSNVEEGRQGEGAGRNRAVQG